MTLYLYHGQSGKIVFRQVDEVYSPKAHTQINVSDNMLISSNYISNITHRNVPHSLKDYDLNNPSHKMDIDILGLDTLFY